LAIQQYIKQTANRQSTYEFKDPNIKVKIWSPLSGPIYDHEYLARLTHILTHWIRQKRWSRVRSSDRWTIDIYLTPMKKRWCNDSKEIGICDANSGETEQSAGAVTVRIIRAECCVRTIIHELLHAHQWDRIVPNGNDDSEGVVEAIARMFYCQWFGRSQWRSMLDAELAHSKKQVQFLRTSRWSTSTHIRAYYYLATALLSCFPEFSEWLTSSSSSSTLRSSWPGVKERAWKELYRIPTSASMELPIESNNINRCISLAMVQYQAPLTVETARIEFLKPPSKHNDLRFGGRGLFFLPSSPPAATGPPGPRPIVTLLVAPSTTIRFPNARPRSRWMVTDGQGFVSPFGWVKRGQTFEIGRESMDLSLRNENRWYPFIVVQTS
jgi:hypothetical protein